MSSVLQHAALETQLAESSQEVIQLRAHLTALESELATSVPAQHLQSVSEGPVSTAAGAVVHVAHVAEVAQLQAEVSSKEQQIAMLTRQLGAATATTSEVRQGHNMCNM